ncbi:glycosyltransferase family 2 protein [Aliagarivorans marinus]|uniref:glycosyltransferase family 2 protein n=1 Tax=Aliagarivorans marinus TaxID=561965 RepID=UPI00041039EC|nr:glycosyltransferase family 2 protein [Aliagarivorans marinus]
MLEALFWLLVVAALYSYFIYPMILWVLARLSPASKPSTQFDSPLKVSVIVTAYNEQQRIEEKLQNCLELDYDSELFEVIIASDCSDDDTDQIVQCYAEQGVRLVRAEQRLGKENAQWAAIQQASGDILVFSDVATKIPSDAIGKLIAYFADPKIGAISSEDRFVSKGGEVAGEGAYVNYEMWLRRQESRLAGLVGLSGSFFAARQQVCQEWDIHSPSDFNTALNCAKQGYKAVTASDVLGYYTDLKDSQKEYARKVRTVIRGMTALERHPEVLNPFSFGLFSFQIFSHKLMRWLVPWVLAALFVVSAMLSLHGETFALAFALQLLAYVMVIAAHYHNSLLDSSLVKLAYFFFLVNLALFDASCKFLTGVRMTVWQPSAR